LPTGSLSLWCRRVNVQSPIQRVSEGERDSGTPCERKKVAAAAPRVLDLVERRLAVLTGFSQKQDQAMASSRFAMPSPRSNNRLGSESKAD